MKQLFFFLILFVIVTSCSKKDVFTVEGTIEDGGGKKIALYRMDLDKDVAIDSMVIKKNGSFRFKTDRLTEPTFFKLQLTPTNFITLLGDTTEHIQIIAQAASLAKNYEVSNSLGSKQVQILKRQITGLRAKIDSLTTYFQRLPQQERASQLERLSNEIVESINQYKRSIGDFVMENPRSFASYYALFLTLSDETMVLNVMDKQDQVYFATIATSLNLLYPESARVKQLYDYVLNVKTEQRKARMFEILANAEGSGLPEIKEKDVNGNEIALTSLKGKVVLLSFWASWDNTSRRENQNLKRIYQKYKGKGFEIYQVGLERSRVLWENALIQDEIPWISVTDLKYTDSFPARIYNVQQIPANYLISREGEIIGKDLFGNRLDEKLKEIL